MAYKDAEYGNALEAALAKMITRHAVGEMWVGFSAAEKPAGVLLRDASLQSRGLYAGLWQWASDKGLVLTEAEWQAEYAANGVCHKYSDGDGSTTFRMPSAPLYIKGAENAGQAGAYVAEGLPNITGTWFVPRLSSGPAEASGAFYSPNRIVGDYEWPQGGVGAGNLTVGYIGIDASRSNSIYGASTHVTPATSKLLFGVWAVSTAGVAVPDANAEEILGQVEMVSSQLPSKADIDLSNLTTAGKEVAAKMSMPSSRYVELTLGASGTQYTAPADGWFVLRKASITVNQYMTMFNYTGGYQYSVTFETSITTHKTGGIIPMRKGDVLIINYSLTGDTEYFRFIYAEGAE